jgi:hypothetical protein
MFPERWRSKPFFLLLVVRGHRRIVHPSCQDMNLFKQETPRGPHLHLLQYGRVQLEIFAVFKVAAIGRMVVQYSTEKA